MNRYEALQHAVKAHGAAQDKRGQLYVLHAIAAAEAITRKPPAVLGPVAHMDDAVPVALLHDVWENTDYDLPTSDLHPIQYAALRAITKLPDETYFEYIERVSTNEVASIVKLADLWHNLQPERQTCLPGAEQISLEARYLKAARTIWDAQGHKWWPA